MLIDRRIKYFYISLVYLILDTPHSTDAVKRQPWSSTVYTSTHHMYTY
jgi:hypothetical protein